MPQKKAKLSCSKVRRRIVPVTKVKVGGWYSVTEPNFEDDELTYLGKVKRVSRTEASLILFEIKNDKLEFAKYLDRKVRTIKKTPLRSITKKEQELTWAFDAS